MNNGENQNINNNMNNSGIQNSNNPQMNNMNAGNFNVYNMPPQNVVPQNNIKPQIDINIEDILNSKSKNEKLTLVFTIIGALFGGIGLISLLMAKNTVMTIVLLSSSVLFLAIFLPMYLYAYSKRKKMLNREDIGTIKSELMSGEVTVFDDVKVYLTKNYIVSQGAYSSVLKYNEIALIYNEKRYSNVNGVSIDNGFFSMMVLNSGKKFNLFRTRNEEYLNLVEQAIISRNPNIMYGKSKENKERLKQIKQNYKNGNIQ